ncbi:MAG TPA: hypothetical protein PL070_15200 [Flavobacteriales bacterium]|nr:hypothetical protein [Flavobacteriales bacterium]
MKTTATNTLTLPESCPDLPDHLRMTMVEPLIWNDRLFKVYVKVDGRVGEVAVSLQEMDPGTLTDLGELRPVGRIHCETRDYPGYYSTPLISSHDGSFLAYVVTFLSDEDGQGIVLAMVVDKELKPVWSKASSIPLKAWKFLRSEVKVDGRGNVLFSVIELAHAVDYTPHADSRVATRLFQLNEQGVREVDVRLPSGLSPENMAMCSMSDGVVIGGYSTRGKGGRREPPSTFLGRVDANSASFELLMENELAEPISGWIPQIELLQKNNGGYYLVGAVATLREVNSIHVQSISSSSNSEWQWVIPRKHGNLSDRYDFKAYSNSDKLSVVFEETAKNFERLSIGEPVAFRSEISSLLLCRADFSDEGRPTYVKYEDNNWNGAFTLASLNKSRSLESGEQMVVIPETPRDFVGPVRLGFIEVKHGDLIRNGR